MNQLPNRLFYKIGEVSQLLGVEPYVLRYWETEFKLKLSKSKNGQRLYQKKDIDQFTRVKDLLYKDGFTISGARKKLKENKSAGRQLTLQTYLTDTASHAFKDSLAQIKKELEDISQWVEKTPL